MKISSIVDIVNGDLKNSPAISFITQAHTNIHKVNDGDLFISSNKEDIYNAISNGAFAIVYDCSLDISTLNNEIAYIKVEDINKACIKLLRFKLSNQTINCIICDKISFNIFEIYKQSSVDTLFLEDDIINNYELIMNNKNIKTIISSNRDFLKDIYPLAIDFKISKYKLSNLIVHSLFETSFSFKNIYFHKLKLPLVYVDNFISVVEFFSIEDIDTTKLKYFKYMNAIFIDNENQIIDYGKSNRFIIANDNEDINYLEIAFLNKFYTYGKIKILDTKDEKDILKQITNHNYNALYIKSKKRCDIEFLLKKIKKDNKKLF